MEFLRDLWHFLRVRRKWWLAPLIIVLITIGVLIALGSTSVLAPFIYVPARFFGRSGIIRKAGGNTYFKDRNHRYAKENLLHPW